MFICSRKSFDSEIYASKIGGNEGFKSRFEQEERGS